MENVAAQCEGKGSKRIDYITGGKHVFLNLGGDQCLLNMKDINQ